MSRDEDIRLAARVAARSMYHQPIYEIRARGLLFDKEWLIKQPTQLVSLVSFRCSGAVPAPALKGIVAARPGLYRRFFLENMALEALRPNREHAAPLWASLDGLTMLTEGDVVTVELLEGHSARGWSLVVNYRELL